MSDPPLQDGERVVFDHIPSHSAFRRTALVLLAATLIPTIVIAAVMPDTIWTGVPLFVTCVLLMQERVWLGRYRAWVTNRRIILQRGEDVALWDVTGAEPATGGVKVATTYNRRGIRLRYPADPQALCQAIVDAREGAAHD